jgi:hypothetical protein
MSLPRNVRGSRALIAAIACACMALSPAVADAATKKAKHKKPTAALREARGAKPKGAIKAAGLVQSTTTGLGNKLGLGPSLQLAAMNTAINAAPVYFAGHTTGCNTTTAMLAAQPGSIMAGNFRVGNGNCYVWLNLEQSSMLTGSEICKTALHEMGHLNGLEHVADPLDVMFSPFRSDPIPAPCVAN